MSKTFTEVEALYLLHYGRIVELATVAKGMDPAIPGNMKKVCADVWNELGDASPAVMEYASELARGILETGIYHVPEDS
ncbi:MAG: hypothetical protein IKE43_04890 [Coriobacteriales bacterium]|nr:hypothetical protein [Coriobacteriales bacterium]